MPGIFITGTTADGSDAKVFEGMHVSSDGKFWSSQPISPETERFFRKQENKQKWKDLINQKTKR